MKKTNVISLAALAVLAVTFVSSCNKEEQEGFKLDSRYVQFVVSTEAGIDTKSNTSIQTSEIHRISEDGVDLFITSSRTVNNENPFKAPMTKGAVKTINDIREGFKMYMFADAFEGAPEKLYKDGVVKSESNDGTYWSFWDVNNEKIVWPDEAERGATYSFVSTIGDPSMALTNYAAHTVHYRGLLPTEGATDEAAKMKDLLVAYTAGVVHDHAAQNAVELNFYHPLAAIRFHVSSAVTKITMTNVRQGATLTYKSVNPGDPDDFKKAFEWEPLSETEELVNYTQAFSTNQDEMTFFLVPQVFNMQRIMLTFDVVRDGKTHQISTLANNLGCDRWESGYIYNYYIDENEIGKVGIQIDENNTIGEKGGVTVKSNVVVTNTKRSTAFLRATIVANWCSVSGRVISSYEGTIPVTSNWVKGSDGYYYYPESLRSFESSKTIIDSFPIPDNNTHHNQHLVVTIAAQAVEADAAKSYVKDAWATSADGSTPTVGGKTLTDFFIYK